MHPDRMCAFSNEEIKSGVNHFGSKEAFEAAQEAADELVLLMPSLHDILEEDWFDEESHMFCYSDINGNVFGVKDGVLVKIGAIDDRDGSFHEIK